jgi:hypothetical protein
MGLLIGAIRLIEAVDQIMPDNWAKASCPLKMFFIGVHTSWVPKDKSSSEGKVDDDSQMIMR